ncbi:hypothetical protein BDA99DRAFT_126924 [Phascolomyces articulosus]|uniref:JmjC domain-containing protein n=1 Tax=Phascolomyces articulosus TaxID=60185 RepID=A0AAD5KPT5_9FUNG|nr:hypothetical protein BDA99DRAFT_126924 [Phascolomyces articulosus]
MPKPNLFDNEQDLPSQFIATKRINILDFIRDGDKGLKRESLLKLIEKHCVEGEKPLVIGNMHELKTWDHGLFNVDHLNQIYPDDYIELFNMKTRECTYRYTLDDYIKSLNPKNPEHISISKSRSKVEPKKKHKNNDRLATKKNTNEDHVVPQLNDHQRRQKLKKQEPATSKNENGRRTNNKKTPASQQNNILYAKDLSCPDAYMKKLSDLLPDYLLPLGSYDLFKCMPDELRAENLMCYVGGDLTGTALHRDICGTMGHNLMSYGEEGAYAEWYFIENRHRDTLLSTFHPQKLKGCPTINNNNGSSFDEDDEEEDGLAEHEQLENRKSLFIESDRAWVHRGFLKKAGFQTQVAIQRLGDLVIIPSLCYHQVRNVKTSVKIAWNRATSQTLKLALEDQLPIYQSLVRPEIYRCKAMVYYSLQKYREKLWKLQGRIPRSQGDTKRFLEDCQILLHLFAKYVISSEMIEAIPEEGIDGIESSIKTDHHNEDNDDAGEEREKKEADGESRLYTIVCDFCCADIFNRHYRCVTCDNYDLCLSCYSQGRGCEHLDQLTMYQSSQSIQFYLDFYWTILHANEEILEFLGYPLFENEITTNDSFYSLATTCRRIESYRKTNGILSTFLICGHCKLVTTFSDLYQQYGLDPCALFKRKRCPKLSRDPNDNTIYTCKECTSKCEDGCHPFPVVIKELTERVYYSAPRNDPRNWGGPFDVGVYDTSYWPDRRKVKTWSFGRYPGLMDT